MFVFAHVQNHQHFFNEFGDNAEAIDPNYCS